jgi:hypothetical protein
MEKEFIAILVIGVILIPVSVYVIETFFRIIWKVFKVLKVLKKRFPSSR